MSHQSTADHYDTHATDYERQWQGYLENTHSKMLELLLPDLREEDVILDASCGTGLLASRLIEHQAPFRELVLNDLSPRMLGVAESRLPDDPRITYRAYPVEELAFESNRFTRVVSLNSLHNYEYPPTAIRQFRKCMTPDGRLYVIDWDRAGGFRLLNWLFRWRGRETINTVNLNEVDRMLGEEEFTVHHAERWSYRYWRLFGVVAGFLPWRA